MNTSTPPPNPLTPDRWFRIFPSESETLVRVDEAPARDEDVNALGQRLEEIATQCAGHLAIDLTVVEWYSWTWIRALLDLSAKCAVTGKTLEFRGMNEFGRSKLKANRNLVPSIHPTASGSKELTGATELLPIGGSPIKTRGPSITMRRSGKRAA